MFPNLTKSYDVALELLHKSVDFPNKNYNSIVSNSNFF